MHPKGTSFRAPAVKFLAVLGVSQAYLPDIMQKSCLFKIPFKNHKYHQDIIKIEFKGTMSLCLYYL